ncbi:MAG: hypothetical protein KGK07_13575 [Chloroflexota bacterium]|nr:hypothetical protein [Chloroflexota bacterium]
MPLVLSMLTIGAIAATYSLGHPAAAVPALLGAALALYQGKAHRDALKR